MKMFIVLVAVGASLVGLSACKDTKADTLEQEVVATVESGSYASANAYEAETVTLSLVLNNGNYTLVYNGGETVRGAYEFDGLTITLDNGVVAQYIANTNKITIIYEGTLFTLA